MTTDEMRKEIKKYCTGNFLCEGCLLSDKYIPFCYDGEDEDVIKSNYETIFGKTKFTRDDLKPCMVVKLRKGDLCIVSESIKGLCLIDGCGRFMELKEYNLDMFCISGYPLDKLYDIIEVYGFKKEFHCAMDISTDNRELLFKREEEPSPRDIKIKELQDKMDAIKREMDELK